MFPPSTAFPLQAHGLGVRGFESHSELYSLMNATRESNQLNEGVPSAVFSMLLTVIASSVSISLIVYRCTLIQNWSRVPLTMWLVLAIHANTWAYFTTSAVLRYLISYNVYGSSCDVTHHICIVFFTLTKLMSLFLVERAHIVLFPGIQRRQSRLYILNLIAVICVYTICFALFWPFQYTSIIEDLCIAGVTRVVLLLAFLGDGTLNVYLTGLFLVPLLRSHSFRDRKSQWPSRSLKISAGLRELALRTFMGSVVTLVSISINMIVFIVLRVEPIWFCLVTCEADSLVTTMMVHWIAPGERQIKSDRRTEQGSEDTTPHVLDMTPLRSV